MVLTKDYNTFFHLNRQDLVRFLRFKGTDQDDIDDIIQDFYLRVNRYNIQLDSPGKVWLTLQRSWADYYTKVHMAENQDNNYGQGLEVYNPVHPWYDTTATTSQSLSIYDFERWYLYDYVPSVDSRHRTAIPTHSQFKSLCYKMAYGDLGGKSAGYQRLHAIILKYREFYGND